MLNLQICWFWKSPPARIVETHKHPCCEILVITRGTYEYEVRRKKHVARAGDVVIYPPNLVHKEQNPPDDPPEMYILKIEWDDIPHNLPLQVFDRNGRLRVIAEWLNRHWNNRAGFWEKTRQGYMYGIVAELLRLIENPENQLVTDIRRYIYEHMHEPISLNTLAKHLNMSRTRFSSLYRKISGVTPMSDVRQIRFEEAERLLLCSDMPLKNVAAKVGFSTPFSFSNAMRKYKGMYPSQIRANRGLSSSTAEMKSIHPDKA